MPIDEWARDREVKDAAEAENLNDWIRACNAAEAARDQLAEALRRIHEDTRWPVRGADMLVGSIHRMTAAVLAATSTESEETHDQ